MTDYSLRDLRCLDVLLRECHVGRAAIRMGISQPAMSMVLARLRDIFGDTLLTRRGNRMQPTNFAEDIHDQIKFMIIEMEALIATKTEFDPARSDHRFTLILTDYIDAVLTPKLYRAFETANANISLKIVGPDPIHLGELFNEGRVDLTVSYFPNAPKNLISKKVYSDRMTCLVRRGHPALNKRLSLDDFCALDHVSVEPAEASMYRTILDDALADLGESRHVAISKPDFTGIPFMLLNGNLVATMPSRLALLFQRHFNLTTFDPPLLLPPLDIQMMWHERTQHSAPHVWLRDRVLAVIQDQVKEMEF